MALGIPSNYEAFNSQQTKRIAIVVRIDGVADVLTNRPIYTRISYGDPGLVYGQPGMVYGGLRPWVDAGGSTYRDILSLEGSSLTISQKLEPEQGRASISSLSLAFVDRDEYMTQLVSPGVMVDEILGREVEVFLGYEEISYPYDYYRVFRGFVSEVSAGNGLVTLSLSDPNVKRRKQTCFIAKTKVTAPVGSGDTSISVASTADFLRTYQGPGFFIDPRVQHYIKIDNEWIHTMLSGPTSFGPYLDPDFHTMARGARGTAAATHAVGAEVSPGIEIHDDAMSLALKLMLSGWGGPWITGVEIASIGESPDPSAWYGLSPRIYLPPKTDAKQDYGLVEGDYLVLHGSTNNPDWNDVQDIKIVAFEDFDGESNRVIVLEQELSKEAPTAATVGFRSKYDLYSPVIGLKLSPMDVDVEGHEKIKNEFEFIASTQYRFFITEPIDSAKSFIEEQIYLPAGLYSVTRRGKLSVGMTRPPVASEALVVLNKDNIVDAKNIKPVRSVNGRAYFNEIQTYYDAGDDGEFGAVVKTLDAESLGRTGIPSALKIESKGAKTDLGTQSTLNRVAEQFLARYKNAAVVFQCKVNWEIGNLIEAGDVIGVQDDGTLKIPNFETGTRQLGTMLFEVVDRQLDLRNGVVTLKLSSGLGWKITDRYGSIAPSSLIVSGSTSSVLRLADSFGAIFPGNEVKKWKDHVGQRILVHSYDWTVSGETTILGIDESGANILTVSPALGFTPSAGYIIDIADYAASSDPFEAQDYKALYAFLSPTVAVTGGVSSTVFTVGAGDIGKFFEGCQVRVHSVDFATDSGDVTVESVDAGTNRVTVSATLGFTPAAGQVVELIGFADGSGPYRWV